MSKWLVALAAAAALLGLATSVGTLQEPATTPTEAVRPARVSATPAGAGGGEIYYDHALRREWKRENLPFFLRDYHQIGPDGDPLERAQEAWRFLNDTRYLFEATSVNFHGGIVERRWWFGDCELRVVYTSINNEDGVYYFSTPSGPIPLYEKHPDWPEWWKKYQDGAITEEELEGQKKILSQKEFIKIELFFRAFWEEAIKDLDRDLLEITRIVRRAAKERLGLESLDRPVPWDVEPPLTIGEVLGLELYDAEYYLPDVIYFGPIQAWGFCIAGPNIPVGGKKPERRIAIHPQAVGFDWILGKHATVLHELVHAWQSFPLGWWYDVELWNEIYSNAIDAYSLDFLNHPYLSRLRAVVLRYWNFDADYARQYIWDFHVGGVYEINPERFREMHEKVLTIYRELKAAVPYLYREFYSDPIFWVTVSDFMKDDAFALDLLFATLYEATCLGDPEDSPQEAVRKTQKWCKAHADEIDKIWDETLKKMKEQQRERKEEKDLPSSILAISWWNRLPRTAQAALMDAYERGGIDAVVELLLGGGDL